MNITISRRRALTGALAVAAAGAAAACGSSSGSGNTNPKTVTLLSSSDPRIVDNLKFALGPDFTTRTGITVTFEQAGGPRWPDVDTRLQSDLTAGHRADVALIGTNAVRTYADSQLAQPLDSLIAQPPFDASQFQPALLGVDKLKGQTIAVPYCVSTLVLFLNTDVLRKAGLDPNHTPATFSELKDYATKIVNTKAARYGVAWPYDTDANWALQTILSSAGASFMDPAEKQVTLNQPLVVQQLQYWRDLVQAGSSTVITSADLTAAFLRGDIGMMLQSSGQATSVAKGASFSARADLVPVPDGGTRRTTIGGGSAIILAQDENVRRSAWQVVAELIGAPSQTQLVKATGYTSANQKALSDPQYLGNLAKEQPLTVAGSAQIATLAPWYQFPGSRAAEAQNQLRDAVVAALNGTKPVGQAMDDVTRSISSLVTR